MNFFELLIVFSAVMLCCLYFWWLMIGFHIKIDNKNYYPFHNLNNLFVRVYHGSSHWYYNPWNLSQISTVRDLYFVVNNTRYSLWKDV
ncbi:MAG: hypothetical protein GXO42_00110 [bacterium]|nr:hypothetical protein [bacterium]